MHPSPPHSQIRAKKEDEIRKKLEEKAQAQAFANALTTIGKFLLKKKTGEKDQIYGSVQVQEIADAIYQQTGRNVSDCEITVPEIKSVGTYECTIRLHPEVRSGCSWGLSSSRGKSGVHTLYQCHMGALPTWRTGLARAAAVGYRNAQERTLVLLLTGTRPRYAAPPSRRRLWAPSRL